MAQDSLNMNREDYRPYFEILELPPDASLLEVRKAYQALKELYTAGSMATLPLEDEFSEERKEEILRQVDEAYHKLLPLFDKETGASVRTKTKEILDKTAENGSINVTTYDGPTLRQFREALGLDFHDIALATKIQIRYLKSIENEDFEALPPEVYTRGFVVAYSRYLSLDSKQVADDYMKKYREWKVFHAT